jgi:hypothetical protein
VRCVAEKITRQMTVLLKETTCIGNTAQNFIFKRRAVVDYSVFIHSFYLCDSENIRASLPLYVLACTQGHSFSVTCAHTSYIITAQNIQVCNTLTLPFVCNQRIFKRIFSDVKL